MGKSPKKVAGKRNFLHGGGAAQRPEKRMEKK